MLIFGISRFVSFWYAWSDIPPIVGGPREYETNAMSIFSPLFMEALTHGLQITGRAEHRPNTDILQHDYHFCASTARRYKSRYRFWAESTSKGFVGVANLRALGCAACHMVAHWLRHDKAVLVRYGAVRCGTDVLIAKIFQGLKKDSMQMAINRPKRNKGIDEKYC